MGCQLILLNYGDEYSPGTTIEGKVICTFTERENIESIKVRLQGQETSEWTEEKLVYDGSLGGYRYIPIKLFGTNEVVAIEVTLRNAEIVTPGTFEYPFTLELSNDLPSSFNGTCGQLCYYLHAMVKYSSNRLQEDIKDINIEGPVDLNDIPYGFSKVRTKYSDEQLLNICCLGSVSTIEVFLDKEAFVIEEPIKVTATIKNNSNKDFKHVLVELKRIIMEKVTVPKIKTRQDTEIISTQKFNGVKAHHAKKYTYKLTVPHSVKLHNLWRSKLFKEWFILRVATELSEGRENLLIEVRLVIGNIQCTTLPSVENINVPSETLYPPIMYEVEDLAINHMTVPGETPYPPSLYQGSFSRGQNIGNLSQVASRYARSGNDDLPTYQEAIDNPNIYPPPPYS